MDYFLKAVIVKMIDPKSISHKAVLRIGEVVQVEGRKIYVAVDKDKNSTDLIFNGDVLKNISVNSHIEIKKGFLSLIGKVDGERTISDLSGMKKGDYEYRDLNKRVLTISLSGYIDKKGHFVGGMKELPLIGNEAFLLTREKLHTVHSLVKDGEYSIKIAKTESDEYEISLPIDGLFNSHIAIFGNTGSGKSNTLAALYQALVAKLRNENECRFKEGAKFVLYDFNGEYGLANCITEHKEVYNLTTQNYDGDKLPLAESSLMDLEVLSILADATDKTQKPFIRRALRLYKNIKSDGDPLNYYKNILKKNIERCLQMSDKIRVSLVLDYFREILPDVDVQGQPDAIDSDLEWNNTYNYFYLLPNRHRLDSEPHLISESKLYKRVDCYQFPENLMEQFIHFLYVQLIFDILTNRAQNEHIAPAINKLKSKKKDVDKVFDTTSNVSLWKENFIVINLNDLNLDMKKTVPLLLSKKLYKDHKKETGKALTFIIDEAHNILSKQSFREAESWKDYRLETFEEIIKEGRKFGVFVTISSQRPSDISPTITSQAHNYFIHRLINQKDLSMISSVVSYVDKITEDSIPVLPTGVCIFSGVSSPMPLKLIVNELDDKFQPKSKTLSYKSVLSGH